MLKITAPFGAFFINNIGDKNGLENNFNYKTM